MGGAIMDIAVSSSSMRVARVDEDGDVCVSAIPSGNTIARFPIIHSVGGQRLALGPKGYLYSADYDKGVSAYSVSTGEQLWLKKRRSVQRLSFDVDTSLLYVATDHAIHILEPESGTETQSIRGWTSLWMGTLGVAIVATKQVWGPLALGGDQPAWTKKTRSLVGVLSASVSAAGVCVSEGADEDWDLASGTFLGLTQAATTSCYSQDGTLMWARESPVGCHTLGVAWCEEGGSWALLEQNYHASEPAVVVAVDVGGRGLSETRLADTAYRACFSADGNWLVTDGSVYRVKEQVLAH